MINAAMQTAVPTVPRPGIMKHFTGSHLMRKRPTSIMVHVKGHGARRIYRSDFNNRYFILLNTRRVEIQMRDALQLIGG